MQEAEATIARGQQGATQQCRADTVTLPLSFESEGGFGLARKSRSKRTQLRGAAHRAADEKAVHHRVQTGNECDVVANELVGHPAGKTITPALRIQTQQMVAIFGGLADPQFADHTACGEDFLHWVS